MYTQVFFCLHTIANACNRNLYAPNVQPNHTWHIRLRSELSSRDECCCEITTTTARTMKKRTIRTLKKPQSECAMRVKVDGVAKATSMKIGRTRQKLNWINVSLIRNESLEHTMCLFLFFSLSFFFYITILQPFSLQYQRHRSFCDATFSAEASSSSGIPCTQAILVMLGHMCVHGFLLLLCVQ